ncbi:23S rRNA (uracil(1939)-C(5))-methyltransferase RlmD [Merismopedia glauca]|uniref:23S rRNA (Uracil(1939)-C(5))-methyltransferase RlmD n=1 Tax=Merismopedia glauca CCAP 1448/3 TaxID=1296344 RepID=A0A2T1C503_9CYAN|nr:23S rRNA (uracil(1939)-C(5))-methyltransferase RlmD [Merismopedia glauca]PSB03339.1 23S rRNA (uracil(1939)-C(5))-methyltransferase RlmD [Merismopedia glauca CCAP 1448/3]
MSNDRCWQQGKLLELEIIDFNDRGEGVGKYEGRVVFVPDTVPGDVVLVRLDFVKPQYAVGKLQKLVQASGDRIRPACIVADKCGGCQWQHLNYAAQLEAKRHQVIAALQRIGKISNPPVAPVLAAPVPLAYRNKATYPVAKSATQQVQAGYYRRGTHQLINLNQCPVQDSRLNPLLAEVKQDIQNRGWSIYDEVKHDGIIRHLSLRIGRHTGEILLTLVVTNWQLPEVAQQAQEWLERYPQLVGVCLNCNSEKTNAIFGKETRCVLGKAYLEEEFANLRFQLRSDTFFQVYTEQAEALLELITERLELEGNEVLLDAYCGIGTFTLPLALKVKQALGIEMHPASVEQARVNAKLNGIENVEFWAGTVQDCLPKLDIKPDIVILDPPRQGCDRQTLETLKQIQPHRIVYISCKPATLARDLQILCELGIYSLQHVQPTDFFPQTPHVECAAFLVSYRN